MFPNQFSRRLLCPLLARPTWQPLSFYPNGRFFKEAYNAFQNIGGYKDSPEQAQSAFTNLLNTLKVGESVLFGTYEQDDNIANGPEFVEWQVLDIQDGKILLLSKYALVCARYNISPEETTWERSTVRSWLNNDFLNSAFAEEERRLIALSTVEAHKNPIYKRIDPGNDTHDHIFCLSVQEITEYLPTQTDRMCEPTEHAINRGTKLYSGNWCYWWTRTPGRDLTQAVTVAGGGEMLTSGDIYFMGSSVNIEIDAVRPALWIELNK